MENLKVTLKRNSTKAYYIHITPIIFNHLSHVIVALYRLGATPGRINFLLDWYRPHLKSPSRFIYDTEENASPEHLYGERKGYYKLVKHYRKLFEEKNLNLEEMVRQEFPALSDGLFGTLFHGLIHIGYGYAADVEENVIEGLAYMHFAFQPIQIMGLTWAEDFGTGDFDIMTILQDIQKDGILRQRVKNWSKEDKWINHAKNHKFSQRADPLLALGGSNLVHYVNKLRLPSFYDPKVFDHIQALDIAKWLVDVAFTIFTKSIKQNDFQFLHLVTASWSLLQIIPVLSYSDAVHAFQVLLSGFLAVYVTVDCPDLTQPLDVNQKYDDEAWKGITQEVLKEEVHDPSLHKYIQRGQAEHKIKLVQVAYDMNKCSKYDYQRHLYACAARIVMDIPSSIVEDYKHLNTRQVIQLDRKSKM